MKQFQLPFQALKIGVTFFRNGNTWKKRSTRTAVITNPEYKNTWFYYGQNDQCIINEPVEDKII